MEGRSAGKRKKGGWGSFVLQKSDQCVKIMHHREILGEDGGKIGRTFSRVDIIDSGLSYFPCRICRI